jgi:O-antigen/teichoic acid export membrane protein
VLAAVATAAGVLQSVPAALLAGLQRWRQASIAGLVTGGVATGVTALVLALGGRITAMFAVEAGASAVGLVWTSFLALRSLRAVQTGRVGVPPRIRALNRFALLASVGVIVDLIVWRRSEFFFLDHYSTHAEIAYYSIAFALASGVVRLPASIGTVITPAVANLVGTGERERIGTGFDRAMRLILLCTLPLIAAAAALGPRLIEIVWGSDYNRAGRVLLILAVASILTPMTVLSESLLIGLGQLRVPVLAGIAAAVVDIGAAFLLVPHFGAVGAAFANGAAQLSSGVPLVVYASLRTGSTSWASTPLLRAALASGLAAVVAAAIVAVLPGTAGLLAASAAGAATFLVLSPLLRVMQRDDADWLERTAGHRLGGLVAATSRLLAGRARMQ